MTNVRYESGDKYGLETGKKYDLFLLNESRTVYTGILI